MTLRSYQNGQELASALGQVDPISFTAVGGIVQIDHHCTAGEQTTQAVVISSQDTDFEVAASSTGPWGDLVDIGVVGGTNVSTFHRQDARKPVGTDPFPAFNVLYGDVEEVQVAPNFTIAPTISSITATSARLQAAWSDANAGNTVAAKAIIKTAALDPSAGDWTAASTFDGDEVYSSLTPSTTYYAYVRIIDSTGRATVAYTTFSTAADTTAPVIGGTLTATVNSSSQITLSGPTATDAIGIAKWQRKVDSGSWVDIAGSASGTMPSTAITGLSASTAYAFEVRCLDAAGNTSGTLSASATTSSATDSTSPAQVTNARASHFYNGTADFAWNAATDNVAVTGYDIEYGTASDFTGATATTSATTSKQVTGLSDRTLYYCRVRAYDAAGNKGSWSATFTMFADTFASLNATDWGTSVLNSGAVTNSSSTEVINTVGTNARAAVLYSKRSVSKGAGKRIAVRMKLDTNSISGGGARCHLYAAQATPAVGTDASTWSGWKDACGVTFKMGNGVYAETASGTVASITNYFWQLAAANWATTTDDVFASITAGTYYWVFFDITATGVSFTVMNDTRTTTVLATSERSWASIGLSDANHIANGSTTDVRLWFGEPATDWEQMQQTVDAYVELSR